MSIAFNPGVATVSATASTTSGSTAVAFSGLGSTVEVQNTGNVTVFLAKGGSSVTVDTTGYPILAGQSKLISRDPANETYFAVITASGTAALYATCGEGV